MKSKDIELELRQLDSDIKSNINPNTGLTEINDWVLESLFVELFNNLYEKSVEENYFWEYCSFITFKETFQNRFDNHKIDFPDDDLEDFIDIELSELHKSFYTQEEVRHPYEDEILQSEYSCFTFSFDNTPLSLTMSLDILDNHNNLTYKLEKAHSKKIKFLNELKLHNSTIIDEHNKSKINFKGTPNGTTELKQPYLIDNVSTKKNEEILTTKHQDIFCNNGFELFEYLLENFVLEKGKRGHNSDVLFCYHKLFNNNPKFIHQRTQPFLDWYNEKYECYISQTKTFKDVKTDKREKMYSIALDLFKQQYQIGL
jgi:hypothetical protein